MRNAALTLAAALVSLPLTASAWQGFAASAGTVDEACVGKYVTTGPNLALKPGSDRVTCTIRYQIIPPPYEIPTSSFAAHVDADLVDNGPNARVKIRLMTSGGPQAGKIDSDDRPASDTWQGRRSICLAPMDFYFNAYWVEVDLIRTGKGGRPAIGPLFVRWSQCDEFIMPPG